MNLPCLRGMQTVFLAEGNSDDTIHLCITCVDVDKTSFCPFPGRWRRANLGRRR